MITTVQEALKASTQVVVSGIVNHRLNDVRGGGVFLTGPQGEIEFDLNRAVIIENDVGYMVTTNGDFEVLEFTFHTQPKDYS